VSAFLEPPAAEIPRDAAPDLTAQRVIVSLAVDYLNKTITKLPNFYATRTTVRYEETPQYFDASTPVDYQQLHAAASPKQRRSIATARKSWIQAERKARSAKRQMGFTHLWCVRPASRCSDRRNCQRFDLESLGAGRGRASCGICLSDSGGEIALSSGRLLSSRRRRNQCLRKKRWVSRGDRDRSTERHPSLGTGGRT
jgi:hypothetical protein